MDLEEISRRAAQERENAKPKSEPKQSEKENNKTYDAFSFHTYSRIFPNHMNTMLWGLLVVPGVTLLIIHFTSDENEAWSLVAGIACVAVFLLRWGIEYLRKLATHGSYKNFPSTLGFELEGWNTLGSIPKQLQFRHWSGNTVVQIFVHEHASQKELKYVKDTLDLYMATANKRFYEAEVGGDGRTKWHYHGSLRVRGSTDTNVIGDLYTMINVHVRAIQEKYKIIRKVSVEFDRDVFKVEPPPSSD